VSLSQFRARHAQDLRQRRLDALLDSASPELAIRSLRGDELYDLLRAGDLNEHADLLAHARPEQVQVVLDLALWEGDRLSPRRLEDWIYLIAGMPTDTVGRWIAGLDIELVGLMIRKGARVYDLEIDGPPDEPEGIAWPTPDGLFVLDIRGYQAQAAEEVPEGDESTAGVTSQSAEAIVQLMDRLYRADLTLARRILVGVKAELDSDLEETAYRWRQGRLQDLGFEDPLAAREIFRELDPSSVHLGELRPGTRVRASGPDGDQVTGGLPPALAAELDGASPFASAVSRVTDPAERTELNAALAALANRYLAAERVDPANDAAVAAHLGRLRASLDLGVEYLARQGGGAFDEDRAVDAVRTVAVTRLFRVGVSLTGKLRALARALLRRGPFAALAIDGVELTEEPEATALASVNRFVPAFPRLLDDPPANGERPIGSLADVARLTAAIERAAAAQAMLVGLGARPAHLSAQALAGVEPADRTALDASVLARTALVRLLLDEGEADGAAREAAFRPLTPAEVTRFKQRYGQSEALARRAEGLLAAVIPPRLDRAGREVSARWLSSLAPLEPVLVRSSR